MNTLSICILAVSAAAVAGCSDESPATLTAPPAADQKLAALLEYPGNPDRIPGSYVVVLKEGSSASATATRNGIETTYQYTTALQGFAADLTPEEVAQLRADPSVKYVAEDLVVYGSRDDASPATVQTPVVWNLDRLDQPRVPLNAIYRYTGTGAGVNVYVIDSGIRTTHNEFDGLATDRAVVGKDFTGGKGNDCNGHGTHVAATIAGTTYGVAKGARVYSVRVFGCELVGTVSRAIAAIDWVANMHVKPAVANMSLWADFSAPFNDAVANMVAYGVTAVAAAGDLQGNACGISPASAPVAITVGAARHNGARADIANHGPCIDLYAPGQAITSAWSNGDAATATKTSTFTASPHVAGLAAIYLGRNPTATPALVSEVLIDDATPNVLTRIISGPNRMATLWNGTLSGTGDFSYQPVDHDCATCDYFTTTTPGYIHVWLTGSPGTDFDLELYRWMGSAWRRMRTEATTSTNETLLHDGPAGRYRVRVVSDFGGGTFDIHVRKP